jgi:ubiquitin-protein ligase
MQEVSALQWYLTNEERLKLEIELMQKSGVNFQLFSDEYENLLWRGPLFVCNHYHSDVRLVYPENFPYERINVYVLDPKLPPLTHHVLEDGRICYMKDEEWSPNWTAYAVYLTTIRFLNDFYKGVMEIRNPPLSRHESFLEKIWRGFFK